ncbi:MAG: copper-binding protein [Desulfovibrio sp.]|jgi:Cu/Ag efflux protein CusF|nr:copper-binding protein [Desulfovibrio sp.]
MKIRYTFPILTLILFFVSPTVGVFAASDGGHGHAAHSGTTHAPAQAPAGKVYTAKGKIVHTDKAAGKVTIDHEPVPALKWPRMTMPFRVEDPSLLDGLENGSPVRLDFRPEGPGRDPVIVDIEALK